MAMSAPSTVYQPIRLPDWAWQRAETKRLLADRDIAALFRLAQRYGNASQARIAAAVGISQGRVNEIIHGRRDVANLDVLLRIADGLHMPDDARMALGLAPMRPPATLLGMSGEIAAVYLSQALWQTGFETVPGGPNSWMCSPSGAWAS
jgi:transcriptional regulator with XRE-family HTH domain